MKKIVVLLFIACVGGAAWYYYQLHRPEQASPYLTLYGNIDIRDVALGFRVSGRIESMKFEEGDSVDKGVVLAVLDKEPFRKELALRDAEWAEAQAALRNAEKNYERRAELLKRGTISESAYDEALAARDEARARARTAKASLDLAQENLDDTEIHAPDRGIILTRVREPGSIVAMGAPVYTLALISPVWVRTYVAEPDLGQVYPGQQATVRTDSGGVYKGQVGFISPQAEFTPKTVETTELRTDLVYRLRVIVANPDEGLRQGMPVTVILKKRTAGS